MACLEERQVGFATVFAILGYVGVGSVIRLSEEMKQPKKTVPKAILIAIGMAAGAYILSTYAFTVGWGVKVKGMIVLPGPTFTMIIMDMTTRKITSRTPPIIV